MKTKESRAGAKASPFDLVAGLSVACILLPEAIAYASIAHLPIQQALTALLVGLITYAAMGGSQFAIVSPTSSSAALMAAAVISLSPSDAASANNLGLALVILTGLGLLLFAKAKLGRLSAFVSRPVLQGFSFALAITIIIKQIPSLLGIQVATGNLLNILLAISQQLAEISWLSLAIGILALLSLKIMKRWPSVPGAFLVLLCGITLSQQIDLSMYQVKLVGAIKPQIPSFYLPQLTLDHWLKLAEIACGLLVIIVAESWGSIRSLSLNHGSTIEANRELYALGAANLFSGLLHGMPVGAGFSASTANEQAGAQSKWAGAIAALLLMLMLTFAQHWIALLPEPIVAAAVINALSHALNPKALLHLWRIQRDQYLALLVLIAVLAFGVLHGMLIGVGLSLAAALRSFSQPLVRELAELEQSRDYIDRENHPSAIPHPSILILRPEVPLFFANVDGILGDIRKRISKDSDIKTLIISLEESADIDSSAADALMELTLELKRQNISLLLARVKDPIRSLLLTFAEEHFQQNLFWSVADAVAAAQNQPKP